MLVARDLRLAFADAAGARFDVLAIDHLAAERGSLTVLTGPSGSGKSTLLYALSGLQALDAGEVRWGETEITGLSEARRDRWRRETVGLVFQSFHLVDELSPIDNVLVPVWFGHLSARAHRPRATELLEALGVPTARRRLADLSRGEQQRVALARALLFDPAVILADEPTASLDRAASAAVIARFRAMADEGRLVLAVSHDPALIDAADRVLALAHGRLTETPGQSRAAE
ncbi:MAG: ATP-binding cassette domain-containing protein [Pseudomonadota bacterium]